MPDPTEVVPQVAEAVARVGEFERAEQIAHSITDPERRALALAALAQGAAAAGDFERAAKVTRSIGDPLQQRGLGTSARATSGTGELDRARRSAVDAEQMARGAADPGWQAHMLPSFADAAVAGALDDIKRLIADADTVGDSLTDQAAKDLWLTRLAEVASLAGDFEVAERHVRGITDPDARARKLVELADHTDLPVPRRRRLLGEAFAVGSWWAPLPVMTKQFPQQLVRLVDTLYADVLREPTDPPAGVS